MNKIINCYADIDSLFDYRRMLIQKWITRNGTFPTDDARRMEADRLWEMHFETNYRNRRMDTFEHPHFGLNLQVFKKLFDERTVSDWACGYYASGFMGGFLNAIIDQEQLTELPLSIKGVTLHINVFPYVLDDELKQSLIDHCKTRFSHGTEGSRVDVKVLDADIRSSTVNYYKQFDYVLKYDLLTNPDYKPLSESIGSPPIPSTTFLIPDVLVKEVEDLQGPVADRIFAVSLPLAPAFKIVPVKHSFYDYE